jgi:dipeptidyl aminopeptidase/acylaminoacyl peptidase
MKFKHLILIILFFNAAVFAQEKKPFSIETLYMVKTVGNPVVSPEGKRVAFTVSETDLKEAKSSSEIFLVDTDGSNLVQVTKDSAGKSSLIWDGEDALFFISGSQLNRVEIKSGSIEKITDYYAGVSNVTISPDKKWLGFISDVYPECKADNKCNEHYLKRTAEGPVQANLADELMFRHWTDYSEGRIPAIIIYDIEKKDYRLLTESEWLSGHYMLSGGNKFDISPDGKEICFLKNPGKNLAASTNADLYIMSVEGGEPVSITSDNPALDASPVYSPDGKYIAYKMQTVPDFESDRFRIALYDRKDKTKTVLTEEFDNQVEDILWADNSEEIYFSAQVEGYQPVFKVTLKDKKIEQVTGKRSIFGFDISKDNQVIYNARTIQKPAELYAALRGDKNPKQLTSFNDKLLEEYDFRPGEQFWIEGAAGKKMHVFMVKPHNFDENKKYPVILNVHGGPQSQWMDSFRGDWQVYPGSGYIVIFPNPHGSTGYGQEYTNAISGDYGGKVFEDLMLLVDEIEKMPFVDKDRIGAMGWSFGGYMMNWFQAKTKRFKCLSSMMGLYDLESMWGATEELWFVNWDLKGQPWNSDNYEKYSPSNYVVNFSTPTLIITGEKDYRVPYTQSVQYFTTLQTLGIDSRLIIFENDGHWPSHLKSMPLYYNAHLEWFHKYLGGDPAPYESRKMVTNTVFE